MAALLRRSRRRSCVSESRSRRVFTPYSLVVFYRPTACQNEDENGGAKGYPLVAQVAPPNQSQARSECRQRQADQRGCINAPHLRGEVYRSNIDGTVSKCSRYFSLPVWFPAWGFRQTFRQSQNLTHRSVLAGRESLSTNRGLNRFHEQKNGPGANSKLPSPVPASRVGEPKSFCGRLLPLPCSGRA
jgi:hypothetical protein